jgi:4-diphosphocytidyl-2-C-methyl-D-erythritol kinase
LSDRLPDLSGSRLAGGKMERVILSPAKVNLLLKVVSKRPDGYHNLVSIVDIVSIYDVIRLKELPDGEVRVRDTAGVLPEGTENTIYRAIMLLKERFGVASGIDALVDKRIPMGSGLGGGSSNAAKVMKALVRLWQLPVKMPELIELGRQIGADVPLFLYGRPCVMRGVGDEVSPIDLPRLSYVIVYPNVAVSTREVYERLRIVLTKGENEVKFSGKFSTVSDIAGVLENDLEKVAFLICPEIKTIKDRLTDAGAVGSLMSGSGSAVFGIFRDERGARRAVEKIGGIGSVFIANSV